MSVTGPWANAGSRLLSHQRHSVGDQIHGHGQPATRHAHHRLVVLPFFLLLIFQLFLARIEYRRGSIVSFAPRVA